MPGVRGPARGPPALRRVMVAGVEPERTGAARTEALAGWSVWVDAHFRWCCQAAQDATRLFPDDSQPAARERSAG